MKILNLDAVTPPAKKAIQIAGVNYEIPDVTVEGFLLSVRKANELKQAALKGEPPTQKEVEEQVEEAVDYLCTAIPTLPREVAGKLQMPQLNMIIAFLNGVIDEQGQPVPDEKGADSGN